MRVCSSVSSAWSWGRVASSLPAAPKKRLVLRRRNAGGVVAVMYSEVAGPDGVVAVAVAPADGVVGEASEARAAPRNGSVECTVGDGG